MEITFITDITEIIKKVGAIENYFTAIAAAAAIIYLISLYIFFKKA